MYAVLSFYSDRGINGSYEKKPHIDLTIAEGPYVDTDGRNGWVELISNASNDGRLIDINKERWNQLSVNHSNSRTAIITTNSINDKLTSFVEKVKKFKKDNDISYAINPGSIELNVRVKTVYQSTEGR